MAMKKKIINKLIRCKNNAGTTLIEMIVCFALLGIFMAAAATFISTITKLFYEIKGQTYAREVSDIVIQKVVSEIDGAKYYGTDSPDNPDIASDGSNITLYDKTETKVIISVDSNKLVVDYPGFSVIKDGAVVQKDSRDSQRWMFDENMYNGYYIADMYVYPANKLGTFVSARGIDTSKYGITVSSDYPDNVVALLLHLDSEKYGDYYSYRFIKLYNLPDSYDW